MKRANMSSTSNDPQPIEYTTPYRTSYVISVFICVFVIMLAVIFISFICKRIDLQGRRFRDPISTNVRSSASQNAVFIHPGLDEAALSRLPELPYSQVKVHLKGEDKICSPTSFYSCSICLGDYKESDLLRLLPDCGHVFHVKCVDPWFQMHPTCPICRNSPLATQLAATRSVL